MLDNRAKQTIAAITQLVQAIPGDSVWRTRTLKALRTAVAEPDDKAADSYRRRAKSDRHIEGDLEIDDDAVVSVTETGAYVEAWVWVPKEVSDGR